MVYGLISTLRSRVMYVLLCSSAGRWLSTFLTRKVRFWCVGSAEKTGQGHWSRSRSRSRLLTAATCKVSLHAQSCICVLLQMCSRVVYGCMRLTSVTCADDYRHYIQVWYPAVNLRHLTAWRQLQQLSTAQYVKLSVEDLSAVCLSVMSFIRGEARKLLLLLLLLQTVTWRLCKVVSCSGETDRCRRVDSLPLHTCIIYR